MTQSPDIAIPPARILIVDDEAANRDVLEFILKHEGFLVVTAASGEAALAAVAQQAPDLVLLDVMMPGMNGYDVAAKVKGNLATQHIPVIMVSALHDHATRVRAQSAGADDFLPKPIDRAELCARVRMLLRLKSLGK